MRITLKPPGREALEYPLSHLESCMRSAVEEIAHRTKAPVALCAQSVLGAVNFCTQSYVDIVGLDGSRRPSSLFLGTIARSSERKTSCDALALKAVRNYQAALVSSDPVFKRSSSEEGPIALSPQVLLEDVTFEGIQNQFEIGQPGLGLFTSEGGLFSSGYSMSKENRVRTAAGLSALWDGRETSRVRKLSGAVLLINRRLCAHIQIQPDASRNLFGASDLKDQGLTSRFLVCFPESKIGTRLIQPLDHHFFDDSRLTEFYSRCQTILEHPLPLRPGTAQELEPRVVSLSQEAMELLVCYANQVEKLQAPGQCYSEITGFAGKAAEHALRLAATLAFFSNPELKELSVTELDSGIHLTDYYLSEHTRMEEGGLEVELYRITESFLNWASSEYFDGLVPNADISTYAIPAKVRQRETREKVLEILFGTGYAEPYDGYITGKNGQSRKGGIRLLLIDEWSSADSATSASGVV